MSSNCRCEFDFPFLNLTRRLFSVCVFATPAVNWACKIRPILATEHVPDLIAILYLPISRKTTNNGNKVMKSLIVTAEGDLHSETSVLCTLYLLASFFCQLLLYSTQYCTVLYFMYADWCKLGAISCYNLFRVGRCAVVLLTVSRDVAV